MERPGMGAGGWAPGMGISPHANVAVVSDRFNSEVYARRLAAVADGARAAGLRVW